MYRILCDDNYLVYEPDNTDYQIIEGNLQLSVNTAGSLTFRITPDNPMYGQIRLMKSIVELYDDDRLVFRGRPYAPSIDLYRHDRIQCEGELAFFNDTYQPPIGNWYGSVSELFRAVITMHNAQVSEEKRFIVGECNVVNDTDSGNITRSSDDYMITWDFIEDKFINSSLGGYLHLRHETDGTYIDYLSDLNYEAPAPRQEIVQAINITDANKDVTVDGLATVVLPLGATLDDEENPDSKRRLTIADVNHGTIFVEDLDAIDIYGRIVKIVIHDDIEDPTNLYTAGMKDLQSSLGITTTYTITAADLSKAGYDVSPFYFGTYVKVTSPSLGLSDSRMLIKKMNINLLDPASSLLEIGSDKKSLTEDRLKSDKASVARQVYLEETNRKLTNKINQLETTYSYDFSTLNGLYSEVSETVKANGETIAEHKTKIEQNEKNISTTVSSYESLSDKVDNNKQDAEEKFALIENNITFGADGLILSATNTPYSLRLDETGISFLYNGVNVSWWSTDHDTAKQLPSDAVFAAYAASFVDQLNLGKFQFKVRDNGNLSLTRYLKSIKIINSEGREERV